MKNKIYLQEDIIKQNDEFKEFMKQQLLTQNFIGSEIQATFKKLRQYNVDFRVVMQDGRENIITMDYREDRLNFHVENNIITHQFLG